ncbi:MAG: hypothetical protein IT368_12620 [Candidatus Hydrogenedentes bacterium]|nr:hypothetical protein [Candidatus Hydrogenedentota bacterium]
MERSNVAKVSFSVVALSLSAVAFLAMFGPEGCGPSEEDLRILSVVNSTPEILEKGGHVDAVQRVVDEGDEDRNRDDVYRFEGQILDTNGVAIGLVRGGRVEGFGTMRPRVQWFEKPGVVEEWKGRGDWRGRRRGEGGDGGEGRRRWGNGEGQDNGSAPGTAEAPPQ